MRLGEDHPPRHRLQDAGDGDVKLAVDQAGATLDHDHGAVVQEADPLAGLLALLDDLDPQVLAREDGRLHRVRERVDVHHPDTLELGDPVEVEVVGQYDPAASLGQLHELRVHLGHAGRLVVDDLDGGMRVALHPVEDLEPAPPAVAAERVRRIGDVLELLQHEPGHDQRPVDEARLDDLRDPAVDEDAGVDDDPGLALGARLLLAGPPDEAGALRRGDEVEPLRHGQAHHPEAEEQRDPEGQPGPEGTLDLGEREAQQQPEQEANEQADHRRHELRGGQLLHLADEPAGGDDREIREQREPDDHPGDRPDGEEEPAVVNAGEHARAGGGEPEADEGAECGPQDPDRPNHASPRSVRHAAVGAPGAGVPSLARTHAGPLRAGVMLGAPRRRRPAAVTIGARRCRRAR